MNFKTISVNELLENVFNLIGKEWMLISAGSSNKFNTMTASWGGLGFIWNKPVSMCVVRPSRYTYEFMEKSDIYSLSFFGDECREGLNLCGKKSGRDCDKVKEAGFSPLWKGNSVYYGEARLVLICKKLYYNDLDPKHFLDPAIEGSYNGSDYHRAYIGEILECLVK